MKFSALVFMLILIIPVAACAQDYDLAIARGDLPVDLLVAQVYTQTAEIPLVTVTQEGITAELSTELQGYSSQGYTKALVIGGTDAVPESVESVLQTLDYSVTRLWDWDRYGTAARVAVNLWGSSDTVVVAQGDQKGSLMLAARVAGEEEAPLLLTQTSILPEQTKSAIETLGASKIILIGDVDQPVRAELSQLGGVQETRVRPIETVESSGVSIFMIGAIIGALFVFLLSALLGTSFLRKRAEVPYELLNEDEQAIIDALVESGGSIKQEKLPAITDFSRPKVSRLVTDLLERNVIEKDKRGKTYVVRLAKKVRK
jgi:uncharacterized membrane protein